MDTHPALLSANDPVYQHGSFHVFSVDDQYHSTRSTPWAVLGYLAGLGSPRSLPQDVSQFIPFC
jgi:hypothetical protein